MTIKVTVDYENNAEDFWQNLREQHPGVAAKIRDEGETELTDMEWAIVQAVEGFSDGPEYARTALIASISNDNQ